MVSCWGGGAGGEEHNMSSYSYCRLLPEPGDLSEEVRLASLSILTVI